MKKITILFLLISFCGGSEESIESGAISISDNKSTNSTTTEINHEDCLEWKLGSEINVSNLALIQQQFFSELIDYNSYKLTDDEFDYSISKFIYRVNALKDSQKNLSTIYKEISEANLSTQNLALEMFIETENALLLYKQYISTKDNSDFNNARAYLENSKNILSTVLKNLTENKANCDV